MKKIYLALLALTLAITTQAQRKLKFEVSIDTPTLNMNIITGSVTLPVYKIKNVGLTDADSLGRGETFWFISPQSGISGGDLVPYGVTLGNVLKRGETFVLNTGAFTGGYKIPYDSIKTLLNLAGDTAKAKPFTANKQYNWYLQITNINYLVANPKVDSLKSNMAKQVIWINKSGTGINEESLAQTSITTYPNPASNQLSFDLDIAANDKAVATVVDAAGRTILVKELDNNNRKHDLDISTMSTGMYMLRLAIGDNVTTAKFNVQK